VKEVDSSEAKPRQRKIPVGTIDQKIVVNTQEYGHGLSRAQARTRTNTNDSKSNLLLERILERGNLFRALERVEKNKGAAGIDGLTLDELRSHLKGNWIEIKSKILDGTYKPLPVKQVEIPKASGGTRKLGIPSVIDRLIQQAMLQILSPIFDPGFSRFSFGFRPGRNAHQAIRQTHEYLKSGYSIVVDIDLENFFNEVNHDILMSRVARKVADKRVLKLIRAYLNSGIMVNGVIVLNEKGTPQGSPLSPLLSNILLDDLDKELERRGHRFCRYADDQNVYVKTKRAGLRVFESISRFLEDNLKLKVNLKKSAVGPAQRRKFLGYSFIGKRFPRIRPANESQERFKEKVREITRGHRSQPIEERIQRLVSFTSGWMNYFRLVETERLIEDIDGWVRTRLRMCLFKQWRKPRTAIRHLKQLDMKEEHLGPFLSGKKYWYKANMSYAKWTLNLQYWKGLGYIPLKEVWRKSQAVT
jgi:RNA-directed DNA polymerase